MLVVDDDRAIAMMLSASLRTMGTVDTASTVDAAAAQLRDHNYDAAVVDMVLDGDATALRNALEARGIPVLLVSGRDGERLQREANEHGWRFLAKPFTQEQVMRELSAMLDLDDAPDNQATPSSPTITQPPPTPANHQPEPTTRKPTAVDLIDRLADIAGMACIVALAWRDKIDGTVALGGILGVLGVSGSVRHIGRRSAGLATASVAIFAALTTLAHPSPAAASHRQHTDRHAFSGYAAVRAVILAMILGALVAVGATLASCRTASRLLMDATEGVPPYVGCDGGVPACVGVPGEHGEDGGVTPAVCSRGGRFWPLLPRTADGRQRVCALGCVIDDAGHPVCLEPADAASDVTDVTDAAD